MFYFTTNMRHGFMGGRWQDEKGLITRAMYLLAQFFFFFSPIHILVRPGCHPFPCIWKFGSLSYALGGWSPLYTTLNALIRLIVRVFFFPISLVCMRPECHPIPCLWKFGSLCFGGPWLGSLYTTLSKLVNLTS